MHALSTLRCIFKELSLTAEQGSATLYGSRATLETKLLMWASFKRHIDLFNLTFFKRKWAFSSPFSKRIILRGIFK